MDELADFIAKIRSNQSKIVISRDTLKEIIDVLDDQGSNNINIEAFLQYVFDKEIGTRQQQSPFKTPPESPFPENLESPLFNFRTPLKPFTPFPMKDEGLEQKSSPSVTPLPNEGPFTLSPEVKQQHNMENGPSGNLDAMKPEFEQNNSQSTTNGSWFWGKESPRFAQTFPEKRASTNPNSQAEDGAFNFTTWRDFKFELGAASGAKKVASRGGNKSNKNPTSPIQPPSVAAFTIPQTARTDSTNIDPHDEQGVPITSCSSDGTFKVHSVRPEDSLHTLNEDAANSSDTPSTHSGKSQSTASTFTKYVFEDLPEAVRSGKINATVEEIDNSSDEDSEMSVDDMRSPFFAFSGGKTPVPDTNVQKENQPTNSISNNTTTNEKSNINDESEFPAVDKAFKTNISSEKLDDTQSTTNQPATMETSEEFQFNTDNISSKFIGLNLGTQTNSSTSSSAGYSFSLGSKSGLGTANQKPHIKKLITKKKDHGKTQHSIPPSTDNSIKPGVVGGLFNSSPFVSAQFTDANHMSSDKQEEFKAQSKGLDFNLEANVESGKNKDFALPTGDAPPAWWSAYQQQPPHPTSANGKDPSPSSTAAADSTKLATENETKPASSTSNAPFGSSGDTFDKTLLDILDVYSKQGKQWYSMGQYDKALEAYSNCLNIAPKDWIGRATITGNRAAVNFMMNRYMESVDDCDDALRLDPTLVKLHIRKGKSLIRLGHFNPADAAFWKVLQINMTEFQDIVSDEDYLMQLEQTLTSAKLEAQAGMREVVKLKENMNKLISSEAKKDYANGLKVAEDILHRAPFARNAIEAKARALCELQRYETAKDYIEEVTVSYPANLRVVHAHVSAPVNCPTKAELQWSEVKQPPSVVFSLPAVKQLAFCMGSSMATIYVQVLKNHVFSKNCSADVMQKMFSLLEMLSNDLPAQDLLETWSWVPRETAKLRELLSLKQTADQQFKDKSYRAAMQFYSQALRMDTSAKRWNAILHCNRAACNMCLNLYAEAVEDCNTAIQFFADYHRAYLRRGRAYRAMKKYQESVRDYRRYLCSDPVPVDFAEVQKELDHMMEEKAQETQRQQRQEQEWKKQQQQQQQQQQRPTSARNSNTNSSNSNGSHKGGNFHRPRSAHRHNSNTWAYGASGRQFFEDDDDDDWNDDDDDDSGFNNAYKQREQLHQRFFHHQQQQQQQHQQRNKSSSTSRPSTGSGSSSSTFHRSNSNTNNNSNNYSSARPESATGYDGTSPRPSTSSSNTNGSTGQTTLFSLKEKDHYTVLGVDTAASDRDIKMAYRKLALQFHPDKNKETGAEERFKMISMAYSVLIDKTSRREYDLSRPLPRSSRQW